MKKLIIILLLTQHYCFAQSLPDKDLNIKGTYIINPTPENLVALYKMSHKEFLSFFQGKNYTYSIQNGADIFSRDVEGAGMEIISNLPNSGIIFSWTIWNQSKISIFDDLIEQIEKWFVEFDKDYGNRPVYLYKSKSGEIWAFIVNRPQSGYESIIVKATQ